MKRFLVLASAASALMLSGCGRAASAGETSPPPPVLSVANLPVVEDGKWVLETRLDEKSYSRKTTCLRKQPMTAFIASNIQGTTNKCRDQAVTKDGAYTVLTQTCTYGPVEVTSAISILMIQGDFNLGAKQTYSASYNGKTKPHWEISARRLSDC